jgi:uncharacterized membrane protein
METPETLVAITSLLVAFGLPLLMVAIVLLYKHRKMRMTHETIVKLAEKGIPVPPELLEPRRTRSSGLRGGLVLIALGAGLSIFFLQQHGAWSIGLIPGLMGVALLVAWAIESRSAGKREQTEPPR